MVLSKQQEEALYRVSLETAKDISWIRKQIQDCDNTQKEHTDRLTNLEIEHSLLRSKLRAFILGLTFFVSLLVNGILWGVSRLGGKGI